MRKRDNGADWQAKWLKELDDATPPLADYVKNEPLPEPVKRKSSFRDFISRLTTRRFAAVAGALATLVIIVAAVIMLLPKQNVVDPNRPIPPSGNPPTVNVSHANTVISVEINPEILMSTDADGKVCSVAALNEDADTVISYEGFFSEILGKPLADAVKAYTDMCAMLGFVNYDGDAVKISGVEGAGSLSDIEETLSGYFKDNGIFAVVATENLSETEFAAAKEIDISSGFYESISEMKSYYSERRDEGKELSELLSEYENAVLSGVEIYIKDEIDSMLNAELAAILEELLDTLTNNAEVLEGAIVALEGLMGNDSALDSVEAFVSAPETREEYFEKLGEYRKFDSEKRRAKNRDEYDRVREKIDDADYEKYINEKIREYGSLGNYFNQQKN